ncbi:hypothetical protein [Paratissierella segnis]|uniref:Uncharacterized protein n=1 Tax=Paratissierella segnis TaxID=2763679 RepID=A0A926EZW1_9FIRM|nr:hypothetical protein [Paratissierella segnis]MBC8589344.1 hypothetical protein [Paratissierella segnis]
MQLKKEIEACIKKTSEKTAIEVIEQFKKQRLIKSNLSFYKKTEIILYNYEKLKLAAKQKDEDIKYIEENGLPSKSKSIVFFSITSGNVTAGDRYVELIEKYRVEKAETLRDIARIDNALDKVREDKYFKIIELKYLEQKAKTDEELAEILEKDQSTITRNRNRLINELKTILFPESIKELW